MSSATGNSAATSEAFFQLHRYFPDWASTTPSSSLSRTDFWLTTARTESRVPAGAWTDPGIDYVTSIEFLLRRARRHHDVFQSQIDAHVSHIPSECWTMLFSVSSFLRVGPGGKGSPGCGLILSIAPIGERIESRIGEGGCQLQQWDQFRFRSRCRTRARHHGK
jgi:hypothetical protein